MGIIILVTLILAVIALIIGKYYELKMDGKYSGYTDQAILLEAVKGEIENLNLPVMLLIILIAIIVSQIEK